MEIKLSECQKTYKAQGYIVKCIYCNKFIQVSDEEVENLMWTECSKCDESLYFEDDIGEDLFQDNINIEFINDCFFRIFYY